MRPFRQEQFKRWFMPVAARIEAENYAAMNGIQTEDCGDTGGDLNLVKDRVAASTLWGFKQSGC